MASFSLDFPDADILSVLGDDITLIHSGGGSEVIKGTFDKKYLEDELGEAIDVIVPVIEVDDIDAGKIKRTTKIEFNGIIYVVLRKRPVDTGKTMVILRSD